jgi:type II secretory pathway predicted ATPase ExeA
MTQLTLELSQLEVEPIEALEMGADILQREQNRSLETLTSAQGKNDVLAIVTPNFTNKTTSCGNLYCLCHNSCGGSILV